MKCRPGPSERRSAEVGPHRVAFRTKSEVEVMDDGFQWRKYGKKSVKNSPNPRYTTLHILFSGGALFTSLVLNMEVLKFCVSTYLYLKELLSVLD